MTRLEKKRRERDLTQIQLAERSGVTQATISGIESERSEDILLSTAKKLANALGCTLDEIFLA